MLFLLDRAALVGSSTFAAIDPRALLVETDLLVLTTAFLVLAVVHLVYLDRRHRETSLFLALYGLAAAGSTFGGSAWGEAALGPHWALRLQQASTHLSAFAAIPFLWTVLSQKVRAWLRVYQFAHLGIAVAMLVLPIAWVVASRPGRLVFLLPLVLAAVAVAWQARREAPVWAILLAISPLVFAVVWEVAGAFGGHASVRHPAPYGFGVFLGAMTALQAARSRRLHAELDSFRVTLEQRVEERTAELRQAERQARHASEAKSRFLAAMSHEIRTPMNGLLGLAELLESTRLESTQKTYASTILSAGRSLLRLLDDLLDLSKIEAGEMTIGRVDFELLQLLEGVVRLMQRRADERGLTLSLALDPRLPPYLHGDPVRVRQILLNLLSNALRFTSQGSIRLEARRRGDRLELSVRDSGIGIAAQDIERIFEPFQQAQGATRDGTGLGLAISRRLAEVMGGDLSARSVPGEGSTFALDLPLVVGQEPETSTSTEVTIGRLATLADRLILIAEDNPVNRLVVEEHLAALGIDLDEVDFAVDGSEALELLSVHRYGLVLMDCSMPKLDGYEVTRRFRALEAERGGATPIVALTAHAMSEDVRRSRDAGMDDHLSKPYRQNELAAVLQRWLGRSDETD
ncbi:MAG: ATP-binding protein [Acidobacteriota bacterium]